MAVADVSNVPASLSVATEGGAGDGVDMPGAEVEVVEDDAVLVPMTDGTADG